MVVAMQCTHLLIGAQAVAHYTQSSARTVTHRHRLLFAELREPGSCPDQLRPLPRAALQRLPHCAPDKPVMISSEVCAKRCGHEKIGRRQHSTQGILLVKCWSCAVASTCLYRCCVWSCGTTVRLFDRRRLLSFQFKSRGPN